MTTHEGSLISGTVTCSCGWTSGHYAFAADAATAYSEHVSNPEHREP